MQCFVMTFIIIIFTVLCSVLSAQCCFVPIFQFIFRTFPLPVRWCSDSLLYEQTHNWNAHFHISRSNNNVFTSFLVHAFIYCPRHFNTLNDNTWSLNWGKSNDRSQARSLSTVHRTLSLGGCDRNKTHEGMKSSKSVYGILLSMSLVKVAHSHSNDFIWQCCNELAVSLMLAPM